MVLQLIDFGEIDGVDFLLDLPLRLRALLDGGHDERVGELRGSNRGEADDERQEGGVGSASSNGGLGEGHVCCAPRSRSRSIAGAHRCGECNCR